MPPLELNDHDAADVLARGELEVLGRMPWASNATLLALVRADGAEMQAVYKPRRGERPLWDFPSGTLCQREVATYELSEALGWGLVPATVLRDGPVGIGMVQRFVEHDPEEHYFTLLEEHADRFLQFAVFDVLINNADRKGGHCIRSRPDGAIVGIDHGARRRRVPRARGRRARRANVTAGVVARARRDATARSGAGQGGAAARPRPRLPLAPLAAGVTVTR